MRSQVVKLPSLLSGTAQDVQLEVTTLCRSVKINRKGLQRPRVVRSATFAHRLGTDGIADG